MSTSPRYLKLSIEGDDGHVYQESVWVRPHATDRFEVRSAPFVLRGLAVGDVISPRQGGGWNVRDGGHSTVLVLFQDSTSRSDLLERHRSLLTALRALGCALEAHGHAAAVDVPAVAKADVLSLLDAADAAWDWFLSKDG